MAGCPNLKLTPMFDACTAQDDDGVMCAGPGRTNYARCYRYLRARVKALETAGEGLKRDSSAAIEAISHAIHDPTTWPGIDWSGADVAAKQYEKAVAAWDEAMKGAE